ncbi:MAG: nicotinate-nucleotide adenylyltransferase [Eubacterium sp.]|nr:nicotinate-nucleotide adenylyltransferase [Eubacterium sp.]
MDNLEKNLLYDYLNDTGDIAILGGSFNPIHNGHIAMADAAHDMCKTDVVLMPNKTTYYKDNKVFASDEDRLSMVRFAAEERDYLMYSDMEIKRGGVTHTIDTIRFLKGVNPDRRIYFIIGGDSLEWIDRWVNAEELLESITVLTAVRGATDRNRSEEIIRKIKDTIPASDIRLLDMNSMEISSTDIRKRAQENKSLRDLVPEKIEAFIKEKNIYNGANR